ncbi:MAG TPA: PLP-dependent aminotransferase family protein [Solirubrobacteraceae bacterium]|nr:PLP-dependent aminotransferase family protein [Solirubrobacteraceae bacterium]
MDLHVDLESAAGTSKRARLEAALRDAIRDRRLAPGTRLPPSRALCRQLQVSRGVVVDAYAQLAAEGYLRTRRGGGTTIAELEEAGRGVPAPRPTGAPVRFDLNPFTPALAEFPRATWAAALTRALRRMSDLHLGQPDPTGTLELREALAAYLGRVRGLRADAGRVVVTCGARHGIGLLWAALATRGARTVAIEQPGWHGVRETVVAAGLEPRPVAVDEHGLDVSVLLGADGIDAAAVAPAHQYPTGAVLSPPRRQALAAWARDGDRLVIEDDYDAEYRYDRQPIGCLQGLAPEHVAYVGSASKTLSPALRLGWLALPGTLADDVAVRARLGGAAPSVAIQLTLAELLTRGEIDRHLRRQRRRYARRREALLDALAVRLPALAVSGASAGLFAVLELPQGADERSVAVAARRRGISLEHRRHGAAALVLGYANLAPSAAAGAVAELAAAIESVDR